MVPRSSCCSNDLRLFAMRDVHTYRRFAAQCGHAPTHFCSRVGGEAPASVAGALPMVLVHRATAILVLVVDFASGVLSNWQ